MSDDGALKMLGGFLVATLALAVGSGLRSAYKDAQLEAGRPTGTVPPRWTDANRWDRD